MADEERAIKRMRFTGDIITINVGMNPVEQFSVHDAIIKKHSDFFRKALDKKWEEGQKREINLPDDSGDDVAAYIGWLYDEKLSLPTWDVQTDEPFLTIVRLYIFGEKIQDSDFCNATIDKACECLDQSVNKGHHPGQVTVNMLCKGTPDGSPARALLVDHISTTKFTNWNFLQREGALDPELAKDIINALLAQRTRVPVDSLHARRKVWHKGA